MLPPTTVPPQRCAEVGGVDASRVCHSQTSAVNAPSIRWMTATQVSLFSTLCAPTSGFHNRENLVAVIFRRQQHAVS
jgi:hypothetical protein